VRPNIRVATPAYRRSNTIQVENGPGVKLGQHVRHGKFGEGVVLNYEGSGAHARVQVNFADAGTKWLVMSYANLELM
jgi:DNA helicase-2/ATP-dependent DNA helicase PcrA